MGTKHNFLLGYAACKVAEHSFQEPMRNSLSLSFLFFGARFLQEL